MTARPGENLTRKIRTHPACAPERGVEGDSHAQKRPGTPLTRARHSVSPGPSHIVLSKKPLHLDPHLLLSGIRDAMTR